MKFTDLFYDDYLINGRYIRVPVWLTLYYWLKAQLLHIRFQFGTWIIGEHLMGKLLIQCSRCKELTFMFPPMQTEDSRGDHNAKKNTDGS